MAVCAVCQDDTFWAACDWTTYDGTVITNSTERDAYYAAKYTSLEAWNTAQKKVVSELERVEILGQWFSPDNATILTGWSAGYYMRCYIATVGIARPGNANNYKISVASGNGLHVDSRLMVIDGIEVEVTGASGNCFYSGSYDDNATVLKNCIARGGSRGFNFDNSYGSGRQFINCLAYNVAGFGFYTGTSNVSEKGIFVNCTAYNCTTGFNSYYTATDKFDAINCVAIGGTMCFNTARRGVWLNCVSSDATASQGVNGITGATAAQCFTDATNGDFTLHSASILRGAGVHVDVGPYEVAPEIGTTPTFDLIGNYRHPTPDIGAYEYDDGYTPSVTLSISANVSLTGAEIRIYDADNTPAGTLGTELSGTESNPSTTYTYSAASLMNNTIYIQVMQSGYEEFLTSHTVTNINETLTLTLKTDVNA